MPFELLLHEIVLSFCIENNLHLTFVCVLSGNYTKTLPPRAQKQAVFSVMDLEPEDNDPPAKEKRETVILTQTGVSDQLKSEIKSVCITGLVMYASRQVNYLQGYMEVSIK